MGFVLQANEFRVIRELGWVCPVCQDGARHSIDKLKSDYAKLALLVIELQNKMRTLEKSAADATKTAFAENTAQPSGNNVSPTQQIVITAMRTMNKSEMRVDHGIIRTVENQWWTRAIMVKILLPLLPKLSKLCSANVKMLCCPVSRRKTQ